MGVLVWEGSNLLIGGEQRSKMGARKLELTPEQDLHSADIADSSWVFVGDIKRFCSE